MSDAGAAHGTRPASLAHAMRVLRERANTVLPGLYAWLTTVALPSVQQRAPASARVTAFLALIVLLAAPLFVDERPRLGRSLGIFGYIGLCVLTWLLLGSSLLQNPGDPVLSAVGAVAFILYALGWGSLRLRGAVPEDDPNVIPGPPLPPRTRHHVSVPLAFGLVLVGSLLPLVLAFRVLEPERALFAHATAILAAIVTITVGSRVALGIGQPKGLPSNSERLNAVAVPLALLALLFGLGFLWLVVR